MKLASTESSIITFLYSKHAPKPRPRFREQKTLLQSNTLAYVLQQFLFPSLHAEPPRRRRDAFSSGKITGQRVILHKLHPRAGIEIWNTGPVNPRQDSAGTTRTVRPVRALASFSLCPFLRAVIAAAASHISGNCTEIGPTNDLLLHHFFFQRGLM